MLCALSAKLVPLGLERHFGNHVQGRCTQNFETSELISYCGRNHQSFGFSKKNWHQVLSRYSYICCILFCFQVLWIPGDLHSNLLNKQIILKIYLSSSDFWDSHPLLLYPIKITYIVIPLLVTDPKASPRAQRSRFLSPLAPSSHSELTSPAPSLKHEQSHLPFICQVLCI